MISPLTLDELDDERAVFRYEFRKTRTCIVDNLVFYGFFEILADQHSVFSRCLTPAFERSFDDMPENYRSKLNDSPNLN